MIKNQIKLYLLIQKYWIFFPYVKDVNRLRKTNLLVSEKLGLIVIDKHGNKQSYVSISKCSKALGFAILTI